MRTQVYSQELITTNPGNDLPVTALVTKEADTGVTYSAVRLYLHSPPQLHHTFDDDDRSAVTFWLPKSPIRREYVALALEDMAEKIRHAPPETGLD